MQAKPDNNFELTKFRCGPFFKGLIYFWLKITPIIRKRQDNVRYDRFLIKLFVLRNLSDKIFEIFLVSFIMTFFDNSEPSASRS